MNRLDQFEKDEFQTSAGTLSLTFFGHGSLLFVFQDKTIYVDPFSRVADYTGFPKADLVLITHEHLDHLDPQALAHICTGQTSLVLTQACAEKIPGGIVLLNGDRQTVAGIPIQAMPAYNLIHRRENGEPFHPKGRGNGYILTMGDVRVYIAGDTENIPEMKSLTAIDIAFLPMNLPYTMNPEMALEAARSFHPKILYPYHYGETDPHRLVELLQADTEIEVRIRKLA